MLWTLAADAKDIRYIYVWSAVMIAMLLLAFAGYSYFKRWMTQSDSSANGGFTLSDLRKLHEQGEMSDAEYETTRANMLASAKKLTQKLPEVFPDKSTRTQTMGDRTPPAP